MASASAETASSSSQVATAAASPTTERRGIPAAQFVEDVQTFLSQLGLDVNSALAFLQERSLSLSPPPPPPSFFLENLFLNKKKCELYFIFI